MKTASLGRLTKVDLRKVFASEVGDFTPWLAREENLALLAESIGINLQCKAQETGERERSFVSEHRL